MVNATLVSQKGRNSNLELYRIICMLMIVAHHFVMHSGFTGELYHNDIATINSIFLWSFGLWGKAGINCFLMITGFFMCKSQITLRKFLKLLLEVYFYRVVIYVVFLVAGYEDVSLSTLVKILMPVWGFKSNFISCFIVFYLTIPFINILVNNMTRHHHFLLLILLLGMYSLLGSIPSFPIGMNYVTWFGVIYLIAAYIRLYPTSLMENRKLWGVLTIFIVIAAILSVILGLYIGSYPYFLVLDSNKLLAVAFAVTSFLWMKNVKLPQSKIINAIGGSTFGVYLIHDASDAMRIWLWTDTIKCVEFFSLPIGKLLLFSFGTVLLVFLICIIIDRLRIRLFETPFFSWYDKKFGIE